MFFQDRQRLSQDIEKVLQDTEELLLQDIGKVSQDRNFYSKHVLDYYSFGQSEIAMKWWVLQLFWTVQVYILIKILQYKNPLLKKNRGFKTQYYKEFISCH